jgi:hypothetical protein
MRTLTVFAGPVLALVLAGAQTPGAAQPEPADQEKVRQFVAEWMSGSGLGGSMPEIDSQYTDLNGDGQAEAMIVLRSTYTCGARACSAFVLDLSGPEARSVGDLLAVSLDVLPTSTNGWQDISVDGRRVTFGDGHYRTSSPQ